MDQPLVSPVMPQSMPRHSRRVLWMALPLALVLLAGGGALVFVKVSGWIRNLAVGPWKVLHEAAVALQTPPGARAFYGGHPGLAEHFTTADQFVTVSRGWAPKLATLPDTVPDLWSLVKAGGNLEIQSGSGGQTTFSLRYREVSARLVLRGEQLLDLQVE
jgi:hypothetical protein